MAGPHNTELPVLQKGQDFDLNSVEKLNNALRLPMMVNILNLGFHFLLRSITVQLTGQTFFQL